MRGLSFRLLGQATVTDDGGTCVRLSATKGLALLCYLAMNAGRPVRRTELANLLWGDRPDAQARQNLRQAIFTIRRDLGADLGALLSIDEQVISLASDAVRVDALEFTACATSADLHRQQGCLDLPWGPFLHGFSSGAELFDEWMDAERGRIDTIATRVFAELAGRADAAGNGEQAIAALERLISIDPTEEDRHRRLLVLEARYRGVDAALARGKQLAAMLKRELDLEPDAATTALLDRLRQDAEATRASPSAPVTAAADAAAHVDTAAPAARPRRPLLVGTAVIATVLVGSAVVALRDLGTPAPNPVANQAVHTMVGDPSWASPGSADGQAGRLGGVVSIAVLPFVSLGDQGEEAPLLAAVVTDDLTDVLSRIDVFRVISRQTAATYAAQKVDAATIGAELGIRYLLEGSVSLRGELMRVNVSLVDAKTRLQIWSGRFERAGADRLTVQDEIVNAMARDLHMEIGQIESVPGSKELDVHAMVFKGWQAIRAAARAGQDPLRSAEKYFRAALEVDPDNARAQHGLAAYHTLMAVQLYGDDPASHIAKADAILRPLIDRHPNMSGAYASMGLLQIARQQPGKAAQPFQRALALNPSDAGSHAQLGRILARTRDPKRGLEHILYAIRLSPRDPLLSYWLAFAGTAELELSHYDRAIDYLDRALALNPGHPRTVVVLVAAKALAGRMDQARTRLQDLRRAVPHLSKDVLLKRFDRVPGDSKFSEGLRLALSVAD